MLCPTCGAAVAEGLPFCPRCGTQIEAAPPSQPVAALSQSSPLRVAASLPTVPPQLLGVPILSDALVLPTPAPGMLARLIPARYATNRWLMAALGALVAALAGLALTALVQPLWAAALAGAVAASPTPGFAATLRAAVGTFLTPDVLRLFALAHHIPLFVQVRQARGPASDTTLNVPLTGLLLVPALALTLGGYVAAAGGRPRATRASIRSSIARGVLIGPFYGLALLLLALVDSAKVSGAALGLGTLTLQPAPLPALLYGVLWGALFGALGGWIAVGGRAWLGVALPALRSARNVRLAGALTGAGAAFLCGILLMLVVGLAAAVVAIIHAGAVVTPSLPSGTRYGSAAALPPVVAMIAALGPAAAVWLLALATGAALDLSSRIAGPSSGSAGGQVDATTLGFVHAQHLPTPQSWYLLAVIPFVCYLIGGWVAARVARPDQRQAAFVAGAAIALPLGALMAAAAAVTSASADATLSGARIHLLAGPSVAGTFLAMLVCGGIVGGLGGVSTLNAPWLGEIPRVALGPVRPLGRRLLFPLLDWLTARAPGEPISAARGWMYDGLLAAVALGVAAVVLDVLTLALASPASLSRLLLLDECTGALLVGVPPLYLIGALVAAFTQPAPGIFQPVPVPPPTFAMPDEPPGEADPEEDPEAEPWAPYAPPPFPPEGAEERQNTAP